MSDFKVGDVVSVHGEGEHEVTSVHERSGDLTLGHRWVVPTEWCALVRPTLPPEPTEPRTVVFDRNGKTWTRSRYGWWVTNDDAPRRWADLHHPVRRAIPAPDPDDEALVDRVTAAIRETATLPQRTDYDYARAAIRAIGGAS